MGRPIAFATLIVIAVFLPLFGMSGVEGRMYRPLAAAVVATMAASLLLALTLVPVASALFLLRAGDGRRHLAGAPHQGGVRARCSTRACGTRGGSAS